MTGVSGGRRSTGIACSPVRLKTLVIGWRHHLAVKHSSTGSAEAPRFLLGPGQVSASPARPYVSPP